MLQRAEDAGTLAGMEAVYEQAEALEPHMPR
jgi:hypothetical protein